MSVSPSVTTQEGHQGLADHVSTAWQQSPAAGDRLCHGALNAQAVFPAPGRCEAAVHRVQLLELKPVLRVQNSLPCVTGSC